MEDKRTLQERYHDYMQQLAHLRQLESLYRADGNELYLQHVVAWRKQVHEQERALNKRDIELYWQKVSGESDYPHSLKTAFPEFLDLLDD